MNAEYYPKPGMISFSCTVPKYYQKVWISPCPLPYTPQIPSFKEKLPSFKEKQFPPSKLQLPLPRTLRSPLSPPLPLPLPFPFSPSLALCMCVKEKERERRRQGQTHRVISLLALKLYTSYLDCPSFPCDGDTHKPLLFDSHRTVRNSPVCEAMFFILFSLCIFRFFQFRLLLFCQISIALMASLN